MTSNATGFMLQTMLFMVNHSSTDFMHTVFNESLPHPLDPNEEKCFGAYGCFPINHPWKSENRAHNVFPFSPIILDVKFSAFSRHRKNPITLDLNDPFEILDAKINKKHPLFFVTHGFLEYGGAWWIKLLIEELLIYDKHATVIVVDWRGGSSPPYYQSVANIRLVGAIVAHMISSIFEEVKMENLDNLHLIGHSLGAHMFGYAGYYLQRDFDLKLGRITGLDPAGPYFLNTEDIVRLDKSDAKYVDIVHSDVSLFVEGGFGIKQSIGHLDQWPNGGDNHPACVSSGNVACDHVHAVVLFMESINTKCPFMAITCSSFEAFKKGKCSHCNRDENFCFKFGYHSISSYKHFYSSGNVHPGYSSTIDTYLITGEKQPFCRVHYKVFVKVASNDESRMHGGEVGFLYLRLKTDHGEGAKFVLNQYSVYFAPGTNHTFLATGDNAEGVKSVTIDYKYKSTANPLTWRVFTPKIYLEFIVIESMEHVWSMKLCPHHSLPISSGEGLVLTEEACDYRNGGVLA